MNIFKKNAKAYKRQKAIENLRVIYPTLTKVHIKQIATEVGKMTAVLLYDLKDRDGFVFIG